MTVATFTNPLTTKGLSFNQRIAYVASLFHWTIGIPKFIFYMAPPWMLFTGTFPIAPYNARFLAVCAVFLGSVIVSLRSLEPRQGPSDDGRALQHGVVLHLHACDEARVLRPRQAHGLRGDRQARCDEPVGAAGVAHMAMLLFSILSPSAGT